MLHFMHQIAVIYTKKGVKPSSEPHAYLIGMTGFEPATTPTPRVYATNLRHIPSIVSFCEARLYQSRLF